MAKKNVYKFLFSFEAPDILKTKNIGKPITEFFTEGEEVIGEYYKKTNIIVDNRYIIPLDYLEKITSSPYLKKNSKFDDTVDLIRKQAIHISEKQKEKLSEFADDIKTTVEGKKVDKIKNESVAYKNGLLLGLGVGIITALYFKKNIWFLSLLGASIGSYVSFKIHKAKQGNNVVEPIL